MLIQSDCLPIALFMITGSIPLYQHRAYQPQPCVCFRFRGDPNVEKLVRRSKEGRLAQRYQKYQRISDGRGINGSAAQVPRLPGIVTRGRFTPRNAAKSKMPGREKSKTRSDRSSVNRDVRRREIAKDEKRIARERRHIPILRYSFEG